MNLYTYTANNPLKYIDPSGHEYGKVREFAEGYHGSVTTGLEIVGLEPKYYLDHKREVRTYYKEIYRGYADIKVGDNKARFYYDEHDIKDGSMYMERKEFLNKLGISYEYSEFEYIYTPERKTARLGSIFGEAAAGNNLKKVSGWGESLLGLLASEYITNDYDLKKEAMAETGTYKVKSIGVPVNLGFIRGTQTFYNYEYISPSGTTFWLISETDNIENYNYKVKYGK
ncbi:hypothetical protein P4H70_20245 [Paenibacillus ehimensis]|nr:hypothetical protein [Paenibacillus ehimensis]MEC0211272.1 hypothetical protein [Paenibacillus ehimensis]